MGNDGGSIPDRRDLVKNKPKAEQADKANQTRARWWFCALSKKPLQQPVVACRLGRLYNKDALIEFLLDPTLYGDGKKICGHVRSLKDVKELKLTPNPDRPSSPSDTDQPTAPFVCPLSMKEMNGGVPFVYLLPCGCVFSQAGLKAMIIPPSAVEQNDKGDHETEKSLCPNCGTKYDSREDVFTINPGPEEEERMNDRMAVYLASKPKVKKRKATAALEEGEENTKAKRRNRLNDSVDRTPTMSPAVGRRTQKVVEGLAEEQKIRTEKMSDAVRSIYQGSSEVPKANWISQGTFTRYA